MLRLRKKQEARRDALAAKRLAQVEASVVRLADEDLLDLADIFKEAPNTPMMRYAAAEMAKRGISL